MNISLFSFVKNGLSQGYPFIEVIYNLLPIASEIIIVDCGSTDGTLDVLNDLATNPLIKLYHDTWIPGLGGTNCNNSGNLCHRYCNYDTIVFAEADEVWEESLVDVTKSMLDYGCANLKFWRFQLTQNFQRSPWYLEPQQVLTRVFKRNSCNYVEGQMIAADQAVEVSIEHGYIVDCRNNFRDHYITRDRGLKECYGETSEIVRMVPAHSNYSWNMTIDQVATELNDQRWLWQVTPFRLPRILQWHLGRTTYQIRPSLVNRIKKWRPGIALLDDF